MKYTMSVILEPPEEEKVAGLTSAWGMKVAATFYHDKKQYGNGYHLGLKPPDSPVNVIDLRYDETFDPDKPEEWLERWARSYWTGKNGSWQIKELVIKKAD